MKELIIKGIQEVLGKEISVVEGGFGEGKRCITDKNIAEIHDMKTIHVREAINKNIKRFKENIDFIDLKDIENFDNNLLVSLDYSKMQRSGYERLIEIIAKYNNNNIVNIEDIEEILFSIEFELTEEHKKNIEACYKLINEE